MSANTKCYKQAIDWRYSSTPPKRVRRASSANRGWTVFEEDVLLGLMARQHHCGDALTLATMFNSSLNDSDYHSDIGTPAIQKKVKEILRGRPSFAAMLVRHKAGRVTRQLKMSFHRALKYSGDEFEEDWKSRVR
ncbi:hypothetical protein GP486_004544 [Trichoglossum hirsutum]|uniref:Uncharacterized protein n=1 Tax=Trichoglossum hirsutum TaxID=265104 RepID=A0A9P8RNW3_9PEZI|nr:hypothetical protein GP486_004544 [Trichoglossum hirsutum]